MNNTFSVYKCGDNAELAGLYHKINNFRVKYDLVWGLFCNNNQLVVHFHPYYNLTPSQINKWLYIISVEIVLCEKKDDRRWFVSSHLTLISKKGVVMFGACYVWVSIASWPQTSRLLFRMNITSLYYNTLPRPPFSFCHIKGKFIYQTVIISLLPAIAHSSHSWPAVSTSSHARQTWLPANVR